MPGNLFASLRSSHSLLSLAFSLLSSLLSLLSSPYLQPRTSEQTPSRTFAAPNLFQTLAPALRLARFIRAIIFNYVPVTTGVTVSWDDSIRNIFQPGSLSWRDKINNDHRQFL